MKQNKLMVLLLAAVLTGCSQSQPPPAADAHTPIRPRMVLRYAEVNPAADERTLAAVKFADLISEKTHGEIEIEVLPGAQLGDNRELFRDLQIGSVDMANQVPSQFVDFGLPVSYLKVLGIPFLFRSTDHAVRTMDGDFGQRVIQDINQCGGGIHVLDFFVAGGRNFFTREPIYSLEDFKGLKIRVQPGSIYQDMVQAFGGLPVDISNADLYSALQTGAIDGAENPLKGYYNNKYYEAARYYSYTNHMIEPTAMVISEATWNQLTVEEQQIFQESAAIVTADFQQTVQNNMATQKEALSKAGVIFSRPEDYDQWVIAAQPLLETYGKGFEDVIEEIQQVQ